MDCPQAGRRDSIVSGEGGAVQRDLGTLFTSVEANSKALERVHLRMDESFNLVCEIKEVLAVQHAACAKKEDVAKLAQHVAGLTVEHGQWKFGAKVIGGVGILVMALVNREKLAAAIGKLF